MNRIASLIILAAMALAGRAATPAVVERATAQLREAPALTVTFRVNGTDGTMRMCGEKFRLEIPSQMVTSFDGTDQWTLSPADRELTVTRPTPEELAAVNPLGFIGALRSQFTATTLPDGRVRFTPTAPGSSDVQEIVATFDKATSWPLTVSIKAAAGEMLIDHVTVSRETKPLPSSLFTQKPSKGITLIDLR